jgi:hypothetical protein
MNIKSAHMRLGAAVAVYFLWVGALIAMAVYSSARPPEQIIHPSPATSPADPADLEAQ